MIDPRVAYKSAGIHARNVRRASTRLLFSGIGFSAAYFLDPEHGAARRQQAVEFIRRMRTTLGSTKVVGDDATFVMKDSLVPDPQAGRPRIAEDGLRIAH
jgi:hypothetical protein